MGVIVGEVGSAECDFCGLVENPRFPYDINEPIDWSGAVILKPTLGMMLPNYFLAITVMHMTSFAQLGKDQLERTDAALELYEKHFGGNYFRLEHGSDGLTTCGSGGCIDHAHIHTVQADSDVGEHIQAEFDWQQLDSYRDLADFKGVPYIYLRRGLGRSATHHIVPDPNLPSQWVRRQIAKIKGSTEWDWAVDPGDWQMAQTMTELGWGPGWEGWSAGRWHRDKKTGEWVVRNTDNKIADSELLRTWSLGVPGTPQGHANLEAYRRAANASRKS